MCEEQVGIIGNNSGRWDCFSCHSKVCCTFLCLRSIVKVAGEVMFSFPSGYVSQFASHTPLRFVISQTSMVTRLIHNQNYLVKWDWMFFSSSSSSSPFFLLFSSAKPPHETFCLVCSHFLLYWLLGSRMTFLSSKWTSSLFTSSSSYRTSQLTSSSVTFLHWSMM